MRTENDLPRRGAAVALALLAAGCTVGPAYRRPETTLAPLHSAAAAAERATAEAAPPLDRWWTGFGDPVLDRIVERVLGQNLDLAASLARVEQARAAARAAGARLDPAGELDTQAVSQHQSLYSPIGTIGKHLPGYDRDNILYDFGVGASWELDLAGGPHRTAEAASADAQASEAQSLGVRIRLVAEAADAYLQVRGDQARLALAQDQVTTDQQLVELVKLRFADGAASSREVAQAEALLYQARSTIPPLRIALEGQMNRIDVLMGRQPGLGAGELAAAGAIPDAPAVADEPAEELLRRRPDVIVAERRLAASNARIGAAIADYYPKVSLSALLGFESLDVGHLFTSQAFQPQAALGLRWRLFDFGRVDAEVAAARGANAEALAAYRQSVLLAAEDVENALTSLVELEAQSAELAKDVDALARARDASQEDYKAGAIALTDVLDADRELLVARDGAARTRADAARAAVAAYRAIGAGW